MRLYLIRHGQSTNNALTDIRQRTHDPDLTPIGRQQVVRLGEHFATHGDLPGEPYHLTHIYCSPMRRAMDTARPLAEAMGLVPEIKVNIHEVGGVFLTDDDGVSTGYPGLTRRNIESEFPGWVIPENVTDDGWWGPARGRETPAQFISRAVAVALELRQRADTDDSIAFVSHAAFIDTLVKALLNQIPIRPKELFYSSYNTGVTRIDFNDIEGYFPEYLRIHYLNRVDHLPVEMRTW